MAQHRVSYITGADTDVALIEEGLANLDYELDVHVCKSDDETIEAIKGADVIINNHVPMPRRVIQEIDTAQAIVSNGTGFDQIHDNTATEKGIMIVNTAGFVTEEVANHAIMMLLACAKKLTILHELVRVGEWEAATRENLSDLPPIDGQVLGLVGLGNIGRATARRAQVFGLEVIAYSPHCLPWDAKEYRVELVASLDDLAARSDFVSLHTQLNNETRQMIGERFFKSMKPTAYVINTCRGLVVDEQALISALQDGEVAGAAIDAFEQEPTPADNPLLKMNNVIVTPHSGGSSSRDRAAAYSRLGQEAARILKGTWPMSLVNPEVRSNIGLRPPGTNV